ncbi:hypothetical protein EJ110_NYTH37848 [Nymphaea thermarum]|nr:hypothetical protein EJ110_NYTH37848 [Nymphaea thermarum]
MDEAAAPAVPSPNSVQQATRGICATSTVIDSGRSQTAGTRSLTGRNCRSPNTCTASPAAVLFRSLCGQLPTRWASESVPFQRHLRLGDRSDQSPPQSPLASHLLRLCKDGRFSEAIKVLNSVVRPPPARHPRLRDACARTNFTRTEASVHSLCVKSGLDIDHLVSNSLLSLYFKSSDVAEAPCVFDHLRIKEVVSWTSTSSTNSKIGGHRDALMLF